MTAIATSPTTLNVFLFIVSFLLITLIGLVGYIGSGFNKRIDATNGRFETVFQELKRYRTTEICDIFREGDKEKREKFEKDLNAIGKKFGK